MAEPAAFQHSVGLGLPGEAGPPPEGILASDHQWLRRRGKEAQGEKAWPPEPSANIVAPLLTRLCGQYFWATRKMDCLISVYPGLTGLRPPDIARGRWSPA